MKSDWIQRHSSLCAITVLLTVFITSCAPAFISLSQEITPRSNPANDWPGYMLGNARANFNPTETTINTTTATQLTLHWVTQGSGRVFSQPVIVNGLIYWGSGDGFEHATDLHGHQVWTADLGASHAVCENDPDDKVGVIDTATVTSIMLGRKPTSVLFVGGGDGRFYALNARTGAIIWSRLLGAPPATFLWSSPAIYKGKVYEGVSSLADCPLVQG